MRLRDWLAGRRAGPTKLMLANRLRFETLLSALSAGLIHVSAPDTEVAIKRALQHVVKFLGVDRGGLDEHVDGRPGLRRLVGAAGPPGAAAGHARRPVPLGSRRDCGKGRSSGSLGSPIFPRRPRSIGTASSAGARARRC